MTKVESKRTAGVVVVGDFSKSKDNPNKIRDNVPFLQYYDEDNGSHVPREQINIEFRLNEIARELRVPENYNAAFAEGVRELANSIAQRALPARPNREYCRGEDVIEYIRSDDGLGPWAAANALNRPLIRDLAPGAYMALAEYLRKHELPDDLNIPKKSELLKTEKITPEAIKAARRLLSRVQREKSGTQQSP